MRAQDVMIPDPIAIAAGATSADAAAVMHAKKVSVVPIVDDPKQRGYLGTISDRELLTQCVGAGHDPRTCPVQVHLRTDTAVVAPTAELQGYRLARYVDPGDHHVRSTIVVADSGRRLVGFIPHPEEIEGIELA
jgi:CBS domain-containing protein